MKLRLDAVESEGALPESVRQTLENAFSEGRLPHALLFEGPPAQTLLLSKTVAQALVCEDPAVRPCGQCPACRKAAAGSHPDIAVAGGSGGSRSFHKEEIAALRRDAFVRPNEAPCRVFILAGAEQMSIQAQNALLKLLEEPPATVQFLLTSENASALLPTVVSRVQRLSLQQAALPEDGGLAARMLFALCAPKPSALLYETAPLLRDRARQRATLDRFCALLRDALVLRSGGKPLLPETGAAAMAAKTLTRKSLFCALQLSERARRAVDQNANGPLLITALCAGLRDVIGK